MTTAQFREYPVCILHPACHTVIVKAEVSLDEVIHLTSAMQFAGLCSVVSSMP